MPQATNMGDARPAMVTDAMKVEGAVAYHAWRKEHDPGGTGIGTREMCAAIYLAMHQSAMSGDVVERVAAAISLTRDGFGETPPMPVTEYDRDLARAAIASLLGSRTEETT